MRMRGNAELFLTIILAFESLQAESYLKLSPPWITVVRYVNEKYSVKCESGNQNIMWKYQNGQIMNNRSGSLIFTVYKPAENALYLKFAKIQKDFKGVYYCWTKIKGKEYLKGFELIVIQPVTITSNTSIKVNVLNEGENVEIECDTEGEPPPIINWFFKNKLISRNQTRLHAHSLKINNISWEESGIYTCRAFQKIMQTRDVEIVHEINVRHKPSSTSVYTEIYGFMGTSKNLTCSVSAYPVAYFIWYRKNIPINPKINEVKIYNEENISILEIFLNKFDMYGTYHCEAANSLGFLIQTIELKNIEKPKTPKLLIFEKHHSSVIISVFVEPYPNYEFISKIDYTEYTYCEYDEKWAKGMTTNCLNKRISNTNKTHCKIENLKPSTKYAVRASIQNFGGYGDFSEMVLFRTRQESSDSISVISKNNYIIIFNLFVFFLIK